MKIFPPQHEKAFIDYSVLSFQRSEQAQDTEIEIKGPQGVHKVTDIQCICAPFSLSLKEASLLMDFSHACLLLWKAVNYTSIKGLHFCQWWRISRFFDW